MVKLFVASVKMLYRDRQALFWAMAFPVIFTVVFGLFDFTQTPELSIRVVAGEPSQVSRALVEGLEEVESFTVQTSSDLEAARRDVEDGGTDVAVAIPDDAGATAPDAAGGGAGVPAELEVLYNESNFDENQFALETIGRVVDGLNLRLSGVSSPPLRLEEEAISGRSVEYYDFLLPGLVAMGVMNFSIVGMSVAVARFREQRILRRILATPLRPVKFLAAQVMARVLLAMVQALLIMAVGVYLFGANIYGNVLWMLVLASVANLAFLNLGFAVAGRASNPDAAQGIGTAVSIPMMFLSGVFFPTDSLPEAVEAVVQYLPLTPLIEALREISVEGLSITSTGPQLALLGAWVAASFLIASRSFRFGKA
jgi:ABC-2 type transport system permease protein